MPDGLKKVLLICALILGIWLFARFLLPVSLPFLLGAGLALLAEPMTGFLCRRLRLPRSAAAGISVTAAFCFLGLLLLLLCALILKELSALTRVLPDLEATARSGMDLLSQWLLSLSSRLPDGVRTILQRNITGFFSGGSALLDQAVRYLLGLAGHLLTAMPDSALTLGTAVIASFMISAKLPQLHGFFSRERFSPVLTLWQRLRSALGGWLFAQLKLSGVTWGILTLGFWILGIPHALLWAALTALVDAFPVLGTGTVLIPWSLIAFLQGNTPRGIGLAAVYAVVSLIRSVLEPKLVGKQLGLDPLLTLAALYAGYRLFGLGGMLLAPVVTVAVKQSLPLITPRNAQ